MWEKLIEMDGPVHWRYEV